MEVLENIFVRTLLNEHYSRIYLHKISILHRNIPVEKMISARLCIVSAYYAQQWLKNII